MDSLAILSAILAAAVGVLPALLKDTISSFLRRSRGKKFFASAVGQGLLLALDLKQEPDSPERLFSELAAASKQMDAAVARIQGFTKLREEAVAKLEDQLSTLTTQEGELRKTIEQLRQVPLPAAEYFAHLVNKGEKSSALRDYILFFAGVVVSTIIAIILKHYGLA